MGHISRKDRCKSRFNNYNKTESLSNWITQVRTKKVNVKRQPSRNLRVLAVLTLTLDKAEEELRFKQRERAMKWAKIRSNLAEPLHKEVDEEQQRNIDNLWKDELNDLDNFLTDLKQIKKPVQR